MSQFGPFVILGDTPEDPAKVGDQLTARPNSVVPADQVADVKDEEYQWMRDGADISMATAQIYTLTDYDAGHTITCRYSFTIDGGAYSVVNNDPVNVPEKEGVAPPSAIDEPLDMALIGGHTVVYGFPPSTGTLNNLRNEYLVKGKPLSAIFKNMENKHAAGEK